MAYKFEPNGEDRDTVVEGYELGIAPSPHKGIGMIKNANISTEQGEVMASYGRIQNSMTGSSATGTLTFVDSTHVSLSIGGTNNNFKGQWVTVTGSTHGGELADGSYYVSNTSTGLSFQLEATYNGAVITGFTTGLSATITLLRTVGRGIAYATEPYFSSGVQFYRYYVLDHQGLVWVYDTVNDASPSDNLQYWMLPDNSIGYWGSDAAPSGLGILNGWLIVMSGNKFWVKQTVKLGLSYAQMTNAYMMSLKNTTNPHYGLVGHQGRMYYTDGDYIGEIFPNTSIQVSGIANIQSYSSYTAVISVGTISNLFSGSVPSDGNLVSLRVPAVFFAAVGGTMPTSLTANVVYYIQYSLATDSFTVFPEATGITSATATGAFLAGASVGTLTGAWTHQTGDYRVTFSNGDIRTVTFTKTSTSITWSGGLSGAATADLVITGLDIDDGASGTQYFNTFFPVGTHAGAGGDHTLMVFTPQRVNLPIFETSKFLNEIGNTVLIGTRSSAVYPWNQVDVTPSGIINLPEADTQYMLTVNQMCYVFSGYKGNIYITDGSTASLVLKIPDYCAGIEGTPSSYIEPRFTWGGAGYIRGRVYFGVLDQRLVPGSSSQQKAGNCGGVWSFVPTQNLYIGQDTGIGLRLENQNSYGTYNGYATLIIPRYDQTIGLGPQYFSSWQSTIVAASATYGIDTTHTAPVGTVVVETDFLPVGTVLNKYTGKQFEYKLAAPLVASESVAIKWRKNTTDAFTSAGTVIQPDGATSLSGYYNANFQGAQWVQLQLTLTNTQDSTTSWTRLAQVRMR